MQGTDVRQLHERMGRVSSRLAARCKDGSPLYPNRQITARRVSDSGFVVALERGDLRCIGFFRRDIAAA